MKWNKYKLKTTTQAEDFVSGVLMELGISGIQVEDNVQISQEDKEKQFIDYLADILKMTELHILVFIQRKMIMQSSFLIS